jgi:antibiotic biosynthesis monooxygenase (ABM) superfamily enzyme
VDYYLAWRRKAIAAQAHYPGYLATEFYEPHDKRDEWVDIVRYDSPAHLISWMQSKERLALLKEIDPIVESMHAHRVTGLEGWFAVNRGPDAAASGPPPWKQMLTVLFALYPTVMVLGFLNPLMQNLSLPVRMLISNVLSCSILTWLLMPQVSRFLDFWLNPPRRDWKREALGLGTIAAGLGLFVLVFRAI